MTVPLNGRCFLTVNVEAGLFQGPFLGPPMFVIQKSVLADYSGSAAKLFAYD